MIVQGREKVQSCVLGNASSIKIKNMVMILVCMLAKDRMIFRQMFWTQKFVPYLLIS